MVKRSLRRTVGAAAVAAALVLGSTAAAHATPAPDNGPVTGGTTVMVPEPAGVTFTSIISGDYHSVALGSDGNAYAWGDNYYGQLGDGTNTDSNTPVQVQAPAGVTFTSISAGVNHSVALGSDGNAYAWGDNSAGQLGDGTNTDSNTPVQVQAPAGVTFTSINGGGYHSVALGSDGNAYAWGDNSAGQLGDGTNTHSNTPVQVQAPAGVTFTSINGAGYPPVALGSDGNAYAWGDNSAGQLGDGTNTDSNTPVQVQAPAGVTFTSINGGGYHSVALGSDGNAYAWGDNSAGQLGDGTNTDSNTPVQVQAPAGVTFTSINGGGYHSVALGSDGNAYAWGDNSAGQLGDGTNTHSNTPVQVQAPAGVTFTSINGGGYHSVALGSDGNAYAWGDNSAGQLGDGTNTHSNTPVQVQAPAGVTFTSISGGLYHSVALGSDGNAYAWGANWDGQLGDGTNTNSPTPLQVQAPAGVTFTSISAGVYHSVALGSDGNAYAWGQDRKST